MFRRYAWAALALAAAACGDSGGGGGKENNDAGTQQDAATVIPAVVGKSTETGKACATKAECAGKSSECLTTQSAQGASITFEGGYCSAQCTDDTECNAEGKTESGCPAGTAIKNASATLGPQIATLAQSLLGPLATCLVKCAKDTDCRGEGYKCQNLAAALKAAAPAAGGFDISSIAGGFLDPGTYCLSTKIMLPEGGMPAGDAGAPSDAGTVMDAGSTTDAGSDAGTDAGSDAGDAS